jgi:uncharacterized membrane protein
MNILMNLVLSTEAALTAPIIMMSQNRQSAKERIEARNDYIINQKSETEIRVVRENLAAQNAALIEMRQLLAQLTEQVNRLNPPVSGALDDRADL